MHFERDRSRESERALVNVRGTEIKLHYRHPVPTTKSVPNVSDKKDKRKKMKSRRGMASLTQAHSALPRISNYIVITLLNK